MHGTALGVKLVTINVIHNKRISQQVEKNRWILGTENNSFQKHYMEFGLTNLDWYEGYNNAR
jgi:hypothetical protein